MLYNYILKHHDWRQTFNMSQKHATLKDLAARLGVSTTTIHRALTGKPGISDQLRTTIQNLAVEMNYQQIWLLLL